MTAITNPITKEMNIWQMIPVMGAKPKVAR
jgi:hypothetical protein